MKKVSDNTNETFGNEGWESRILDQYWTFLRKSLENFFPNAVLEVAGDRAVDIAGWTEGRTGYRVIDHADGLQIVIDGFEAHYLFRQDGVDTFLPSERKLVEEIVRVIDSQCRIIFGSVMPKQNQSAHVLEDLVVAAYLGLSNPHRLSAITSTLRATALSTYENREISTGVLLLGTDHDPATPERTVPPGVPARPSLTPYPTLAPCSKSVRTAF